MVPLRMRMPSDVKRGKSDRVVCRVCELVAVFLWEYLWRSDRQREKAVAGNGAPLAVAGVGPVEFAGEGRLQQLWRRW